VPANLQATKGGKGDTEALAERLSNLSLTPGGTVGGKNSNTSNQRLAEERKNGAF